MKKAIATGSAKESPSTSSCKHRVLLVDGKYIFIDETLLSCKFTQHSTTNIMLLPGLYPHDRCQQGVCLRGASPQDVAQLTLKRVVFRSLWSLADNST